MKALPAKTKIERVLRKHAVPAKTKRERDVVKPALERTLRKRKGNSPAPFQDGYKAGSHLRGYTKFA